MTREEVLHEFGFRINNGAVIGGNNWPIDRLSAMADEIVHLRTILDKLREPFKYGTIVAAIDDTLFDVPGLSDNVVDKIIQAAVKAAERDVMYTMAVQDSAFMNDMRQLTE